MMSDRDSENRGDGGSERQSSELLIWLAAFAAAATVVAVGLYFIFRNAAPMATSSVTTIACIAGCTSRGIASSENESTSWITPFH